SNGQKQKQDTRIDCVFRTKEFAKPLFTMKLLAYREPKICPFSQKHIWFFS
ncbi:MAG: hypothetical protein ACI8V2_005167, partial [Candidatus Latescibacterota bacterium]